MCEGKREGDRPEGRQEWRSDCIILVGDAGEVAILGIGIVWGFGVKSGS